MCCRPGFLVHLSDTSRQQLSASRLSVSQLSVSSLPEHRRVTRSRPQNGKRERRAQGAQRISQERHTRMRLPYAGRQEGLARCASVSRACSLPLLCPREGRHVLATTPPPRTQRSGLSCALLGPENRLQDELSCKGRATRALSISMGRGRGAATLQQDTCITYATIVTGGATARPAACIN